MENLCASDVMKMLLNICEKMIHTTCNYITGSAGRLSRFKSLQKLSNDEDDIEKTVLRPVATRWLSIYYCTVRILRCNVAYRYGKSIFFCSTPTILATYSPLPLLGLSFYL